MKKKIIIIILSGVIILTIILFNISKKKSELPEINIIDKKNNITLENYKKLFRAISFENNKAKEYFSESIINKYTINYFVFLQKKFKNMSIEEHMKAVKKYLYSVMEEKKAEEMFALYQKYRKYNIHQYELSKKMAFPKGIEEMIQMLHDLQKDRRDFYGKDTADALYGDEVKASEYDLRKMLIINDKDLFGADKEKRLKNLTQNMWGQDSDENSNPWDQYDEKKRIYKDDLNNMTPEEKREKIKEFRNEIFSPAVAAQLERSEEFFQHRNVKKMEYYSNEEKILNDDSLNDEEKEGKIRDLQNQIYGKHADLFRLREEYRKKLENEINN